MSSVDLSLDSLTLREFEILGLLAEGLSDKEIAARLFLTRGTIKWHNRQIYAKLGVTSRAQAVVRAKQRGLLDRADDESLPPSPNSVTDLPAQVSEFIGRKREIAEVKQLLQTVRLLTLTGVGGIGKTRLALQVAREVADDFVDGVYFVDLAPLSNHALVAKAIADALAVIENPAESLLDTLKRMLAGRELLLLIDNFEHVIEAASLVSALLTSPSLKVLVTSREALRISGELDYSVPPLSLPPANNPGNLSESEAVSLFLQRVRMKLPYFEITDDNALVIAQICTRLDGLPLAIELAAARCRLLTLQSLLARLDSRFTVLTGGLRDAPPRQQTLRHTLDWSYNLLSKGEKLLFARLAAFRRGRSLEAIEAVCRQDLPIDVFDGLAALVDKNLIQQKEAPAGEPRFTMLETIHEYACERLVEGGEEQTIRKRHAEYFVELAERAELELRLPQQARWFQLLELEGENLRLALEWSLREGEVTVGVRLAGALSYFWYTSGYKVEGIHWTEQLLPRLDETPRHCHPKFLISAGCMAYFHNPEDAKRLYTRALVCSRELSDRQHAAWALVFLGSMMRDNPEKAIALVEEGLAYFREQDQKPYTAQALYIIGEIVLAGGDTHRARHIWEECFTLAQQIGDTRRINVTISNLAFLAHHEGDYERAIDLSREALRLACKRNDTRGMASDLAFLAGSIAATGQPQRAAQWLGLAETTLERMGALFQPTEQPYLTNIIEDVRARLDAAAFEAAWAEGRSMTLEQAVADVLEK
jgi:predicted ATPase/DNA-binding CsgD family transcriptional regulator